MEQSAKYRYGGQNPGLLTTVHSVESVEGPSTSQYGDVVPSSLSESSHGIPQQAGGPPAKSVESSEAKPGNECQLLHLPVELINPILSHLSAYDLVAISKTCKAAYRTARAGFLWQSLIQDNVPGGPPIFEARSDSYYEIYKAHDPHWFIPKYKIWFSDNGLAGKFYVAKYNQGSGSIELSLLVAERPQTQFESWEEDDTVIIHSFSPKVRLRAETPPLYIPFNIYAQFAGTKGENTSRVRSEIPMRLYNVGGYNKCTKFMLATPANSEEDPDTLWPPLLIPARHRVRVVTPDHVGRDLTVPMPQRVTEVSDQTFRIRSWLQMREHVNAAPEVSTFATLDPKLWTPTDNKPYRGIFIGDYSGHGCEFLLIHQPDDHEPIDSGSEMERKDDETNEEWQVRKKEERIFRGPMLGIKLTGDPNVPRGAISWYTDDIGRGGFKRYAGARSRWKGARIVRSMGHIANPNFQDDKYIESELIMVSHDVLAQHWLPFGHISYFRRVDIDKFLEGSMELDLGESSA